MSYVFMGETAQEIGARLFREREEREAKAQKERDDKDLFNGMTLGGIGLTSIVLWYLIDKKIY